jgi:thiol-disulfide isomerase/thioredoxin
MTDLAILAFVLAATAALWWWWRRRDGRVRAGRPGERLTAADRTAVGVPDEAVVLLEFVAPGCRACAAAKEVLDAVAGERHDVVVAVADVGEHLDLARAHSVLRAPTTLVVDRDGVVRHRVSGVPDPEQLAVTIDEDARAARGAQ